ncbi:MAG: glycosyl transferase family 28 [Chitinophagaceae bacterium]|nr:glycosyl transferase family 28 [Chitinophagaceae bacterium]
MNRPFKENYRLSDGQILGKPRLSGRQARILVAPLDWGLGHATRCVPIIRELLAQGCSVWLAGEGAQEILLKAEFPDLPFLELPGYRIRYAKTARGLIWKMIQQGPKMRRAILYEHRWLKKAVNEHGFDAVISDNRYGLYHSSIPCVFITHQLTIKSSAGKWTEKIFQKSNYRHINHFTTCWVPDQPAGQAGILADCNLAGELSHPVKMPAVPVHYIGWLSRFQKMNIPEKNNHLLIILSGPEPQRSLLEEIIIHEISHYNGTATIIRGLPGSSSMIPSTNMIRFYNHLPALELNAAIEEASYVICRSGYSSLMDMITLQKKCILIPTPGQPEQEYLGRYLQEKGIAHCAPQKDFSLNKELAVAAAYKYYIPLVSSNEKLVSVIETFLLDINRSR